MHEIEGIQLPSLPVSGLELVRHLDFFDGPLLSQFRHPHGDQFLYYWCDCDEEFNRWMVLRVPEASILRLVARLEPLSFVIPRACQDDFVYFVDMDSDGHPRHIRLCPLNLIFTGYFPQPGAYLPATSLLTEKHSYSVLIEGDWTIPHLGEFPRRFGQVYSVVYGLNVLRLPEFPAYPWRGGYSAVNFFDWAARRIPSGDRPHVETIQYASPGFMRFSLHSESARQVEMCLRLLKQDNAAIAGAYSDLDTYLRQHHLNKVEDPHSISFEGHEERLIALASDLIGAFAVIDKQQFVRTCARPFEAAKIAMTFYRRVRELLKFERDGLVRFPE